jgi:tellurite resistance protein
MNKSHATIFLVRLMGESDGEWSEKEMETALVLGNLQSALKEAPDWVERIMSRELNESSAIEILNQESRAVQMQCLINVLLTAFADGVLDDGEKNVLVRIMSRLNHGITVTELLEAHKAHLDSFR